MAKKQIQLSRKKPEHKNNGGYLQAFCWSLGVSMVVVGLIEIVEYCIGTNILNFLIDINNIKRYGIGDLQYISYSGDTAKNVMWWSVFVLAMSVFLFKIPLKSKNINVEKYRGAFRWSIIVFVVSLMVALLVEYGMGITPCLQKLTRWSSHSISMYCITKIFTWWPALVLATLTLALKFPNGNKYRKWVWVVFGFVLVRYLMLIFANAREIFEILQNAFGA